MTMQTLAATIIGTKPLLMNNPQMVDRFNPFAREMKMINAKGVRRTDDDYLRVRDIEVEAKVYHDPDLGVYVPSSWVLAALNQASFKHFKISKGDMRSGVLAENSRLKLSYDKSNKVTCTQDIVGNPHFHHLMLLKQGQVKVAKAFPIFHKWSFHVTLNFDDTIIDRGTLEDMIRRAARYGGFGDFRPTFGTAEAVID